MRKHLCLLAVFIAWSVGLAKTDAGPLGSEHRVWAGMTYEAWITAPQVVGVYREEELVAFDLIFVNASDHTGANPFVIDLGSEDDRGIFGVLHQHHAFAGGMTSPTLSGYLSDDLDTHFNHQDEDLLSVVVPTEDIDLTNPSDVSGGTVSVYGNMDEYTFGTTLRGLFSATYARPPGPLRTAEWNVAHLVTPVSAIDGIAPAGPEVYVPLIVLKGEIGGTDTAETFEFAILNIDIPEPATMSLLSLGAIAILRRRRRA
jgi:hypothetical protein